MGVVVVCGVVWFVCCEWVRCGHLCRAVYISCPRDENPHSIGAVDPVSAFVRAMFL